MTEKKKRAYTKRKKFCLHMVKSDKGVVYCDVRFKEGGTFATKEEAEAYLEAHPCWPHLQIREL